MRLSTLITLALSGIAYALNNSIAGHDQPAYAVTSPAKVVSKTTISLYNTTGSDPVLPPSLTFWRVDDDESPLATGYHLFSPLLTAGGTTHLQGPKDLQSTELGHDVTTMITRITKRSDKTVTATATVTEKMIDSATTSSSSATYSNKHSSPASAPAAQTTAVTPPKHKYDSDITAQASLRQFECGHKFQIWGLNFLPYKEQLQNYITEACGPITRFHWHDHGEHVEGFDRRSWKFYARGKLHQLPGTPDRRQCVKRGVENCLAAVNWPPPIWMAKTPGWPDEVDWPEVGRGKCPN